MTNPIEWCDMTANPFHGCEHGCPYCYARRFAKRLSGKDGTAYHALAQALIDPFAPTFNFDAIRKLESRLKSARKPRRVFLGSMGDLGGDWGWRDARDAKEGRTHRRWHRNAIMSQIWTLAVSHPRHTFLMLTKNPKGFANTAWPDNVHLGVSATNVDEGSERLEELEDSVGAAGILWVSLEPLMGMTQNYIQIGRASWVVIGAQTGPGAPPPQVDAAKQIVDHCCRAYALPCFVKSNMRAADLDFDWPMEIPR